MKRYVMTRLARDLAQVVVDDHGRLRSLPHLVTSRPSCFEWGYHGRGPSDLARAIVGDVFADPDPSPVYYQWVRNELVAKVPRQGGTITEEEVIDVLEGVLA